MSFSIFRESHVFSIWRHWLEQSFRSYEIKL